MGEKRRFGIPRADLLIPLIIFTLAFAVRMAFMMQVKDSPYWRVPLVDAATYHDAAREMLDVSWLAPLPTTEPLYAPYFQPPLYQAFLALVYAIFGQSVLPAIIIQYIIGSFCCVLTYLIGRRLFDRRTGIVAGVAMALTASQVFYEGRLLPPVLITLLNLGIILLALRQTKSPAAWRWPVIGLLVGLSAITRPDILFFLPALLVWMWIERKTVAPVRPVLWIAVVVLISALPVGLVTLRNQVVGRDLALISYNGGVNFYIANHPMMEKTLGLRMGIGWDQLMAQPLIQEGITRPSESSTFFYKRTLAMMLKYKRATLSNFARKFVWVWRGPEIRRNEDDYYLTGESSLYRALLWQKGNFGFPFGVIAPLALLGMALNLKRRRELLLPYAYVATQVLMLVLFFPCSRYRAPMVPVLLIFATAAVFHLVGTVRRKQFGDLVPHLCLLAAFVMLSTLCPPKFEGTPTQIEAENHRLLAVAYIAEGDADSAAEECLKGLELAPEDPDLHKQLMEVYLSQEDYPSAEQAALECLRLAPSYLPIYTRLAEIYEVQGKYDKAEEIMSRLRSSGS